MKTLEQEIAGHLAKREIGELRKMEQEIIPVIRYVRKMATRVLGNGATVLDKEKKASSAKNLEQAEKNYRLIVSAILTLEDINIS